MVPEAFRSIFVTEHNTVSLDEFGEWLSCPETYGSVPQVPPRSLAHQHSLAQLVPRCSLPIFASSCVARFRPGTRSSLAAARQGLHFPCGFAGCKVSGPFRDRPRVHRRRDCARPSVLFPGRLRTGGHTLPLSCPSASFSAVCGTVL